MNMWAVTPPSLSPAMISLLPSKAIVTVHPLINNRIGGKVRRIEMRDRSKNISLYRGEETLVSKLSKLFGFSREPIPETTITAWPLLSLLIIISRGCSSWNECQLALKVFEDVQKEHWYKPRASLYAEIISALGREGLYERIELLFAELKMESKLEPDLKGFNMLMQNLTSLNMTGLAIECFSLMKSFGCEPDRSSYRILINGLESKGELGLSATVRQEAEKIYGNYLEFLNEEEFITSWK